MDIDELVRLAPPNRRRRPLLDADAQWREVEQTIGLALPNDYHKMASLYPAGTFGTYIHFHDILGGVHRYLQQIDRLFRLVGDLRIQNPDNWIRTPFYPSPGGLLPWARDDNGGQLGWLTEGSEEEWPVVVTDSEFDVIERYEMGVVTFLIRWFREEVVVPFHPPDVIPSMEGYFVADAEA